MTPEKFSPDMEQIKKTSAKVQEMCQHADAGIAILDDLIAQLDEEIRASALSKYRLNKTKVL